MSEVRAGRRAIAGVLLATGTPTADDVAHSNEALAALGWSPLCQADLVSETPESLAPRIPEELRARLLALLYELAGDEPIRRRLAEAYAGLWHTEHAGVPADGRGSRMVRWLIGQLPRHHDGPVPEESRWCNEAVRIAVVSSLRPRQRRSSAIRCASASSGSATSPRRCVAAVERVIVGKRDVVERVLTAMAARGHVLLVDVPGVGKTQLCKAIAAAIDTRFGRIQFTPDLLPMDITGANVFDVRDKQFHFRPGPIFTAHPARRRDQPRDAQDPVGAARGDGGAHRDRRRRDAPAGGAVPGAGDDEPARSRGHVSRCPPRRSIASW